MKPFISPFCSIVISLSAIGMLSSCAVKPYKQPDLPLGKTYYAPSEEPVNDTATVATVKWYDFFTDPLLKELIGKALANNNDLKIARSRILEAEAYYKQSKAAFFPSLSLGASGGVSRLSQHEALGRDRTQYDAVLQFSSSWEIDIWGKLRSAKRAQKAALLQSQAYKDAVQTQLIAEIATYYYNLIAYDQDMKIVRDAIKTRSRSLQTIKLLMASAQENELSVTQAAAQLYYAQSSLPQIEAQIHATETAISILLGDLPHSIERTGDLDNCCDTTLLTTGVPTQLLRYRPDVRESEQSFINAHQMLNVARAQLYPSLTIGGDVGSDFISWATFPASLLAGVTGGLTQPLFNNGKLLGAKRAAEQTRQQALYDFYQTVLSAQKEISDLLVNGKKYKEQLYYLQKQSAALTKATYVAYELLKGGFTTYLDLLYAQESELSARQEVVTTRLSLVQTNINLYRALGGGWEE